MNLSNQKNTSRAYHIFLASIILMIVGNGLILKFSMDQQESDAELINRSGRQRMLSQRITKLALYLNHSNTNQKVIYNTDTLSASTKEFSEAHKYLLELNKKLDDSKIDSLFANIRPELTEILISSEQVQKNYGNEDAIMAISRMTNAEQSFLTKMNAIVFEYQKQAERKVTIAKTKIFILFSLTILVLVGQWFFIVWPLYKKLHKQNSTLSFANKQLSDFAHITSHNLRAPVANLNLLMDIHETAKSQDEKNIIIDKIKTVIGHLSGTLEVLIDSLKVKESKSISLEKIQLEQALQKTKEILSGKILENDVRITSNFSEVSELHYNKVYLDSILLNLISNAIRYRKPDISPKIHLETKKSGRQVSLLISDNGLGINLKRHGDKIFGLSKTFHAHPEAKGVGLFMTKTQIESQGGTITVESEVGQGSKFKMNF